MNIVELFAHIGLKADHAQADQFLSAMRTGTKDLLKMAGVAFSVAEAIKMVNDSFAQALELKKFSAATGASTDELQRWQQVADQASGSGAAVADSIRAIALNQERIKLGQGNISGYQMLGIDPRTDPFKLLELLRQKTQGMSQGMKQNMLASFGVSGDLITTLQLTNKEFDQMAGRAWVISPSMIEGMNKARGALTEAGQALNYFKNLIAAKLAPEITKLVKQFTEWARVNQTQIVAGIQKAWEFLKRMVETIIRAGTAINEAIKSTVGWKVALAGLVLLISPVTAGIMALLLILDDLYVYSKGGKSVFGELVKNFPDLGNVFKSFTDGFRVVKDFLTDLLKNKTFDAIAVGLGVITAAWWLWNAAMDASPIVRIAMAMLALVTAIGYVSDHWDEIVKKFSAQQASLTAKGASFSGLEKAKFDPGVMTGDQAALMAKGQWDFWAGKKKESAPTGTSAPSVNQTVNFVVNGATDPKQFSLYVKAVLEREFKMAQGALSKGSVQEVNQ